MLGSTRGTTVPHREGMRMLVLRLLNMGTCPTQVRHTMMQEGWAELSLDEKRFTMLDRVLRPDLYRWLESSEGWHTQPVAYEANVPPD